MGQPKCIERFLDLKIPKCPETSPPQTLSLIIRRVTGPQCPMTSWFMISVHHKVAFWEYYPLAFTNNRPAKRKRRPRRKKRTQKKIGNP